jgi:hypothetical protein
MSHPGFYCHVRVSVNKKSVNWAEATRPTWQLGARATLQVARVLLLGDSFLGEAVDRLELGARDVRATCYRRHGVENSPLPLGP